MFEKRPKAVSQSRTCYIIQTLEFQEFRPEARGNNVALFVRRNDFMSNEASSKINSQMPNRWNRQDRINNKEMIAALLGTPDEEKKE